jgi:hypothetical protein
MAAARDFVEKDGDSIAAGDWCRRSRRPGLAAR